MMEMFKIILPAVSFLIRTAISCEHKGTIQYENYIILAILKIPKINDKCSSPIDDDEITSGSTKTQILLKVTDYHNKKSFLICWTSRIRHHPVVMLRNSAETQSGLPLLPWLCYASVIQCDIIQYLLFLFYYNTGIISFLAIYNDTILCTIFYVIAPHHRCRKYHHVGRHM